jgi:hypothetical protein
MTSMRGRFEAGLSVSALSAFLFSASAMAQDFLAYQGNNSIVRGQGGTMKTVNGIDLWMTGTPPRRFQVLGSLTDERHKTGIWGMISMGNLERDISQAAKKRAAMRWCWPARRKKWWA